MAGRPEPRRDKAYGLKGNRVRLVSRFALTTSLLAIAIVFGGGGSPAPIAELVVQLAALLALCAWPYLPRPDSDAPSLIDRLLWISAAIFVATPLVQLVPLPPIIWHAFPGRETELAALNLVDAGNSWRPISLAPYQTLASALSLIPPVTMLYFTSRLSADERTKLLAWVAGLALLSALVGVVQVASGDANWPRFYRFPNVGMATGFQDNRNGTADIFLIGVLALCAFAAARRDYMNSALGKLVLFALAMLLILSVILTASRAGTALLLICPAFAFLIFRPRLRLNRHWIVATAGGVAFLAVAGVSLRDNSALNRTWARFASVIDSRPRIWEDTQFAIGQYWPLGAGMGTFTTVFPAAERLEGVHATITNRAHQDYLEFVLETGIAGIVLMIGALLALGYRVVTIIRRPHQHLAVIHCLFGVGALTVLALHSLVDYPLRTMSLATVAALSLALLSRSPREGDVRSGRVSTRRIREVTQ
ncbi:MAG: O-antigen ligase family protein [Sphingomonas sp.]|jgi:O-antigen ligase|uniref:O-antigen ligase family protein n=1 Tax=Sphingomonas sp. TaxID=28214 RepID=UPI003561B802